MFTNYANYTEGRHIIGDVVQKAFLDNGIRFFMMGSSVPVVFGPVKDKLQIIKFPYKYSMADVRHESDSTNSIHDFITQQETIDAYTWLVLDAYQDTKPSR